MPHLALTCRQGTGGRGLGRSGPESGNPPQAPVGGRRSPRCTRPTASRPCRSWSSPAAPRGGAVGLGHAVCMGPEDTDHTVLQSSCPPSRRPWVEEGWLRRGASIRALLTEDSKSVAPGGRVGGLPWWLSGEESAGNVGVTEDTGSILGSERSPGRGHGSPLLYSCLENPTDRGAWWATVQSQTQLKRQPAHVGERGLKEGDQSSH